MPYFCIISQNVILWNMFFPVCKHYKMIKIINKPIRFGADQLFICHSLYFFDYFLLILNTIFKVSQWMLGK